MKLTNYKSISQQTGQGIISTPLIPLIGSMIPSLISGKGCKDNFYTPFNMRGKGTVYRNQQIYNNTHYHKVISNITNLKIQLYLERIYDNENNIEFDLKLSNYFQNNCICLKYFEYTS